MPFLDHLSTWTVFTLNVDKNGPMYPPHLVNVVIECPLSCKVSHRRFFIIFDRSEKELFLKTVASLFSEFTFRLLLPIFLLGLLKSRF